MNKLSRFTRNAEWIMASPASDAPNDNADLLVSRRGVRKKGKILRTYVLVNYGTRKSAETNSGNSYEYMSAIYRQDLLVGTNLSRISAIVHFAKPFAMGGVCVAFSYTDQQWEEYLKGFSVPLIQFMKNHTS